MIYYRLGAARCAAGMLTQQLAQHSHHPPLTVSARSCAAPAAASMQYAEIGRLPSTRPLTPGCCMMMMQHCRHRYHRRQRACCVAANLVQCPPGSADSIIVPLQPPPAAETAGSVAHAWGRRSSTSQQARSSWLVAPRRGQRTGAADRSLIRRALNSCTKLSAVGRRLAALIGPPARVWHSNGEGGLLSGE